MKLRSSGSALCAALVALAACSSTSSTVTGTDGGADAGGGSVTDASTDSSTLDSGANLDSSTDSSLEDATAEDCLTVCEAKAASCGAPDAAADTDCHLLCESAPNATQIACIQTSTCTVLKDAFAAKGTVCGISVPGDGGEAD